MIDIVFASGNEEEFIKIAEQLGFDSLYFADNISEEKLKSLQKKTRLRLYSGCLKLAKGKENARHILEKTDTDMVYALEEHKERDFIHQRNSGLNHVLCGIAAKKDKIIGISFNSILKNKGMHASQMLGRMMQNIRLCRKYRVDACIGSFANSPYEMRAASDLVSFGCVLGLNEGSAKKALSVLEERIKFNIGRKAGKIIEKGIEEI